jgi:hypothetical protein
VATLVGQAPMRTYITTIRLRHDTLSSPFHNLFMAQPGHIPLDPQPKRCVVYALFLPLTGESCSAPRIQPTLLDHEGQDEHGA